MITIQKKRKCFKEHNENDTRNHTITMVGSFHIILLHCKKEAELHQIIP